MTDLRAISFENNLSFEFVKFASEVRREAAFTEKSAIARTRSPARETHALPHLLRQFVQILNKRHRRPVEVLDFRVRGFDDVIFVRRMRAAAVAESEMSGRQLKGFAGEDVTGIRTGIARPEQRVDSELFVGCQLRLDQCRIF